MKPDTIKKQKTSWHRLLARLLELVLSPVDIEVLSDVSVMIDPPEVDILLLRRQTPEWTPAQLAHLPDGIRDSKATDILIEFKYTQSFNEDALQQAIMYDFLYKQAKELAASEVQTVILSAQTPQSNTLKRFSYSKTQFAGVYHSKAPIFEKILLLSLNDLSDEPHNAWIKCFASKKKVKEKTLKQLKTLGLLSLNPELRYLINGFIKIWSIFLKEGEIDMNMQMNFTPEEVAEFGKWFGDVWLEGLTPAERLEGLTPAERLAGLKPAERLAGLKPAEWLADLKPEEIGEVENYLKQLKKH